MGESFIAQEPPDLAACKAELETVLASHTFGRAPAVSKILAFVCNRHFEDADQTINEWTIAIDGLGRRSTFDPEKDAIVRVEFHLLRKRLAQYYLKEGASHAVRITFIDSGYVPRFIYASPVHPPVEQPAVVFEEPAPDPQPAEPQVPPLDQPAAPTRWSWRWTALPVGVATLAVLLFLVVRAQVKTSADGSSSGAGSPALVTATDEIRIAAGIPGPKYIDGSGQPWSGDLYVTGGTAFEQPDRQIYRTQNQDLYQRGREGQFRYDIPAKPGVYELRLHFAETRFGQSPLEGAEARRRFDVSLNGQALLTDFDITRDAAGPDTATVKVFEDVKPAGDGFVHLNFIGRAGLPLLNAIELLPDAAGKPLPVRITCGAHPAYDKQGRFWQADEYFLGGRQSDREGVVRGADDSSMYASSRFGNFSYAIPVAGGSTYRANLRFADFTNKNPGERLFDVFANGLMLLRDFDIIGKSGGQGRVAETTFRSLQPNAQDKLIFNFVPSRDYAGVSAIEIEAER